MKEIHKKVAKQHDKQASILTALIDKKIDAKFSVLEDQITKMFRILKVLKKKTDTKRIDIIEKEVSTIKETLEDINLKSLEEDVFKKFQELNSEIKNSLKTQKMEMAKMSSESSKLKKGMHEAKSTPEADMKNLARKVEALKTKSEWFELELEKVNIRELHERIDELQARLSAIRISQPLIIE